MQNCQTFNPLRWLELRHQIMTDINSLTDAELKEFKVLNEMAEKKEDKKDFYGRSYWRRKERVEDQQIKLDL